jgi:hypothetical protein
MDKKLMDDFFAKYLASWGSLDVDAVLAFFTDDVVHEDTTVRAVARGAKQMRSFVEEAFEKVPEARLELVSYFTDGEQFVIEWMFLPPKVRGISVGRLRDGKICENRDYWDGSRFKIPNT